MSRAAIFEVQEPIKHGDPTGGNLNKLRDGFEMGEHPELYNIMLFTAVTVWLGPYAASAVVAPFVFTALAVWFCFGCSVALPLSCLQRLLCGFAPVALWPCPYPVCSTCCVVLLLSYVQRLLRGSAPIPFAALAVRCCFYLMYSGCCVALPLSCLQRLLARFAAF